MKLILAKIQKLRLIAKRDEVPNANVSSPFLDTEVRQNDTAQQFVFLRQTDLLKRAMDRDQLGEALERLQAKGDSEGRSGGSGVLNIEALEREMEYIKD